MYTKCLNVCPHGDIETLRSNTGFHRTKSLKQFLNLSGNYPRTRRSVTMIPSPDGKRLISFHNNTTEGKPFCCTQYTKPQQGGQFDINYTLFQKYPLLSDLPKFETLAVVISRKETDGYIT